MRTTLDGLREAIADMADGGATLEEIASTIVDTAGLDSERRAALWLYARSCIGAAGGIAATGERVAAEGGRVHASTRPSEPRGAGEGEVRDMPYVRCSNCGLTSYLVRNRWRAGECPGCGEPLWAGRRPAGVSAAAAAARKPGDGLDGVLELAREQLDMDVALLTEIAGGQEVVHRSAGEWPEHGSLDGGAIAAEETFCNLLLQGRIGNVVADAPNDERVADLGMAAGFGVGAWIGVPLQLRDARLYMLCCLAREARPTLGDGDVRFLSGLGETVLAELEVAGGG